MSDPVPRYTREREFHNYLATHPEVRNGRLYDWGITKEAEDFALNLLGCLEGSTIADFGCGTGKFALELARRGGRVLAFDLSDQIIQIVASNVRRTGLENRITCQQMSGDQLAFKSASIGLIYGQSILHHLDLEAAHGEVLRVLVPGGCAVFLEPLVHNPFIQFYRWLTPGKRSPDERPLSMSQVRAFAKGFRHLQHREFCLLVLLAVPLTALPSEKLFRGALFVLRHLDHWLLNFFPFLQRFSWITVIKLEK